MKIQIAHYFIFWMKLKLTTWQFATQVDNVLKIVFHRSKTAFINETEIPEIIKGFYETSLIG